MVSDGEPDRVLAIEAAAALRCNPEETELTGKVQLALCIIPPAAMVDVAVLNGERPTALSAAAHVSVPAALMLAQKLITAAHQASQYERIACWAMAPNNPDVPYSGVGVSAVGALQLVQGIAGHHGGRVDVIAYERPQEGNHDQETTPEAASDAPEADDGP